MHFEEPKVEFVTVDSTQIVFASCTDGIAGGTQSCFGDVVDGNCGLEMWGTTGTPCHGDIFTCGNDVT